MARFRYTRYRPSPLDEIDLERLVDRLKDLFLESGFSRRPGRNPTAEDLRRALARILSQSPEIPEEIREALKRWLEEAPAGELSASLEQLLDALVERLVDHDYLRPSGASGQTGQPGSNARFQLTRKGVDFLGYRTLSELLGALGRSGFGHHRTRHLSTGVASDAHSRPYQFGDTLNLDAAATLLKAIGREGLKVPLPLDYSDLMVHQSDRYSSCATVLMIDCSHSMILYGEDRFTPAKKVALALAHLIRTRFPGDSLQLVLFHDSAEEIPLALLPRIRVGPYHTNTCEGLRLARRLLLDQKNEMRQIIMITDGKPSAVTLPGGRIYKNPFGLDPMILSATFREVSNCRKSGILINTFMLARDYYLVDFVKRVSRICRGKAYFASTRTLAGSVLMDFMSRKTRRVH